MHTSRFDATRDELVLAGEAQESRSALLAPELRAARSPDFTAGGGLGHLGHLLGGQGCTWQLFAKLIAASA